jgi:hypothetical protein
MNANGNLQVDEGAKTAVALAALSQQRIQREGYSRLAKSYPGKQISIRIISINQI